ncbi:MAG: L-dopachrome tautomerase-related protein [Candidatus Sumerlaeia bacterium]
MLAALALLSAGCSYRHYRPGRVALDGVAGLDRRWTGLAISRQERIFVCFPRWSDDIPFSVGELMPGGAIVRFPDEEWNRWQSDLDPRRHFICVQSVWIDSDNMLWILDAANPRFEGVVEDGAKLLKVDLIQNKVVQNISFAPPVITAQSYLNDVRVDVPRQTAYITDSGRGALLVVDLRRERTRRLLDGHPATQSEDVAVVIGGREWRRPDGSRPQVHADGLALSPDGKFLYWQALTGRTLYRIPTRWLRSEWLTPEELGGYVQKVVEWGVADGMAFDREGRLFLTSLEDNAIKVLTPRKRANRVETLVQDDRLRWPDSLAIAGDGTVCVTTSQIHLGPFPDTPFEILRLVPR